MLVARWFVVHRSVLVCLELELQLLKLTITLEVGFKTISTNREKSRVMGCVRGLQKVDGILFFTQQYTRIGQLESGGVALVKGNLLGLLHVLQHLMFPAGLPAVFCRHRDGPFLQIP